MTYFLSTLWPWVATGIQVAGLIFTLYVLGWRRGRVVMDERSPTGGLDE